MNRRTSIPDEGNFPAEGSAIEKLTFALHYAVLAPSVRNTQPWLFVLRDDAVEVRADRSRALPVADPMQRELIVSCGAALEHLVVAVRHFGYEAVVTSVPGDGPTDVLATLRLGARMADDTTNAMLFYALHRRVTDRKPFRKRPVPSDLLQELIEEASAAQIDLKTFDQPADKAALGALIAEADLMQGRDPGFRKEWERWMASAKDSRRDGLPPAARGLGTLAALVEQVMGRKADLGPGHAEANRLLAAEAPLVAVVGTARDDASGWLQAGRSLARLLLRARAAGIFASFFSAPVQVAAVREKLRQFTGGTSYPLVVLRLGFGAQPETVTARRDLVDVLKS